MNNSAVNIYNGGVVPIGSAMPFATTKSGAYITAAIVDAAIKAYVMSPIAIMKSVYTTVVTPIARCP
jgi:hypothetical protein